MRRALANERPASGNNTTQVTCKGNDCAADLPSRWKSDVASCFRNGGQVSFKGNVRRLGPLPSGLSIPAGKRCP